MRVAILGATSHIAKTLIRLLPTKADVRLALFARDPERVRQFVEQHKLSKLCSVVDGCFSGFSAGDYQAVINCVGIGSSQTLKADPGAVFKLTEQFDDLVLDYLAIRPETLYVNFSSGAAYGSEFSSPVNERSQARFDLNRFSPAEYYGIAKLHSEARHRACPDLNIVDLRVFAYFSRFIDLHDRYLMSDVLRAILQGEELVTGESNIVRDYIHPDDLAELVALCLRTNALNTALDVFSAGVVTKFEILEHFHTRFGLRYRVENVSHGTSATGSKDHYYSMNRSASDFVGYRPVHTSLDGLTHETECILKNLQ